MSTKEQDVTSLVTAKGVILFVDVLPLKPSSYEISDSILRVSLENGAAGPNLRIGPQTLVAIDAGGAVTLMETDKDGPARATVLDCKKVA